jgi:hypothetical protein
VMGSTLAMVFPFVGATAPVAGPQATAGVPIRAVRFRSAVPGR